MFNFSLEFLKTYILLKVSGFEVYFDLIILFGAVLGVIINVAAFAIITRKKGKFEASFQIEKLLVQNRGSEKFTRHSPTEGFFETFTRHYPWRE